jgi:hypothetical protein
MSSEPDKPRRRRRFSKDEDEKLCRLIRQHGCRNWAVISDAMPGRNARQCRHRYNNYLAENYEQNAWTAAEDELLIAKYRDFGPKWVKISRLLNGRSGNEVKNRWYKHIVKRILPRVQGVESIDSQTDSGEAETKPFSIALTMPRIADTCFEGNHPMEKGKAELSTFLQYALNEIGDVLISSGKERMK